MYENIHSNLKNRKIKDIQPSSSKKYNSKINRSRIINYLKKFNVWWHTLRQISETIQVSDDILWWQNSGTISTLIIAGVNVKFENTV